MKYTTLNKIRACSPCSTGWNKLLKHLGKTKSDDELLPFEVILDSNGLEDALWCMRSAREYEREWRLFAVWCARQVQHINTDPRVSAAIDAAEDYANGRIDNAALDSARAAAMAAERAAAWAAAVASERAAAMAAERAAALDSARAAAMAAERAAAWAAAVASERAAAMDSARAAAMAAEGAAVGDAAWAASRAAQSEVFRWIVNGGLTQFESEE